MDYKLSGVALSASVLLALALGCGGLDPNKPVATIDGSNVITAGDYLYQYHRAADTASDGHKPELNTLDDARAFLDDLITGRVLEMEAEARGYADDPVIVREIDNRRLEVLWSMVTEDVASEVTVTDDDVRKTFEMSTHPRYFSYIEVKEKAKAEEAKRRLDAGNRFEDVASEFTEDEATIKTGGKLPGPTFYVPGPVYDAIFSLAEKGDYSDIIYGERFRVYYIYKYDGDGEPVDGDFEEEKGEIKENLEKYRINRKIKGYIDRLLKEATVELDDEVYNAVFELGFDEVERKYYNRYSVVGMVGETRLYFDDFWDNLVYGHDIRGDGFETFRGAHADEFREYVDMSLDISVRRALIEVEAERRGITERDEFVREVNRYRGGKLVDELYQEVFVPTISEVTSEDVADYYNRHKADYAIPEAMEGACIIIRDRELVEKVYPVAKAGDFRSAADEAYLYLVDKYGAEDIRAGVPSSGDELVTRFKVTKDVSRATPDEPSYARVLRKYVFDYPEGTVSPIIELGDERFLIFKNLEYTPYEERPLDDEAVATKARRDAQAEVIMSEETDKKCVEWFGKLRAKHEIEVNEGVLKRIFKEIQQEKR